MSTEEVVSRVAAHTAEVRKNIKVGEQAELLVACDGACSKEGNGGWCFWDGEELYYGNAPATTNNQMEYAGLINLLTHLQKKKETRKFVVFMYSQLVVYQMDGRYKVRHPRLAEPNARASGLLSCFDGEVLFVFRETPLMKKVDEFAFKVARGLVEPKLPVYPN